MATSSLTTAQEVASFLSQNVRIQIGDDEPSGSNKFDISWAGVSSQMQRAESEIVTRLSRFYAVPLQLANHDTITLLNEMATKLAAYKCWLMIHPEMASSELPAAVVQWKKEVDDTLGAIVPIGKTEARAGRDIILAGETSLTAPGAGNDVSLAMTRFIPFGSAD